MESIVTASRRMQQQIRDVLALARISEESALNQTVSCDAALDEAIANLEQTIKRNGATIAREPFAGGYWQCEIDQSAVPEFAQQCAQVSQ